jgi:hypothetical protein
MAAICTIVRKLRAAGQARWKPLLAGEDVDRYRTVAGREILTGLSGIKYKELPTAGEQRLLVRKTGIGLRVAIDQSEALTTQTVFQIFCKEGTPRFLLGYLAGVLNSRVMLAFHLRWHGDSEWRSHPYVTPKTLRQLPIPSPWTDQSTFQTAQAIAQRAGLPKSHAGITVDLDLEIERLIVKLFKFNVNDCAWAINVINEAEPLELIRRLKLSDANVLAPQN